MFIKKGMSLGALVWVPRRRSQPTYPVLVLCPILDCINLFGVAFRREVVSNVADWVPACRWHDGAGEVNERVVRLEGACIQEG